MDSDICRETIISFSKSDDVCFIYTTYPYIAKQLKKDPDARLVQHSHDPKNNVEDSWEFEVPLHWFYHEGRLRVPRKLKL